ncbi:hypothetical protein 13VO501A_gene0029 [Vibrio phage 13VO501A]|nr:hypothetical protein 13VO501A_gene0029 [Vibrio phage 13VO501A]
MANLTKTALTKLASSQTNATYRINGKLRVELSPEGAKMILSEFSEAKHEIYNSPREFTKAIRERFGVNWRKKLVM